MNAIFSTATLKWVGIIGLTAVVLGGAMTWNLWSPSAATMVDRTIGVFRGGVGEHSEDLAEHDPHAGHDHESHAGHSEETSLELSAQALRNIGLSQEMIQPIKLQTFRRSITLPALVVERPGRTRLQVATPMTGVVTHVHAVQGEAVTPGTLLFQIRLTHEELVAAQTEFLRTLGELDVEQREIERLQGVTQSGAIAGKILLEKQYARDKLTAALQAQREALRLHGFSESQVDKVASERRLLSELQVFTPTVDDHDDELKLSRNPIRSAAFVQREAQPASNTPLILQQLNVHKGQSVQAGETLCVLADYTELFIEGMAFVQDASQLRLASKNEWTVDAIFPQPGAGTHVVTGLEIAYLANQVDLDSRTLPFYVRLPNEVTKDRREYGNQYVEWKYFPGQRLQLRVPVEEWPDQIVLPVEAVTREVAESYVFQQNGHHFDRVPVHTKYRDQYFVVIENDGSLYPGDVVALRGAHQMQMALKNKSGGGVDPHAGHSH